MMSSNEKLIWNARTDRKLVGERGGQRHILIEVKAPQSEETSRRRPPLNLALVIDASGIIAYTELSKHISDRPDPKTLLREVRKTLKT